MKFSLHMPSGYIRAHSRERAQRPHLGEAATATMEAPPPLLDESSDEEASSVESFDRNPGWLSESDSEMAESESSDEPPPAWWLLQAAQLFEHKTCTTGEDSGVGGDCCSCGEVRPPDRAQVEEAASFVLGRMKQTQSGLQVG